MNNLLFSFRVPALDDYVTQVNTVLLKHRLLSEGQRLNEAWISLNGWLTGSYLSSYGGMITIGCKNPRNVNSHIVSDLATMNCRQFTGNCGAREVSYIMTRYQRFKELNAVRPVFLEALEAFAFYWMKAGLQVGSDNVNGLTITTIKLDGKGYEFGTPVQNINYTDPEHRIQCFWKCFHSQPNLYGLNSLSLQAMISKHQADMKNPTPNAEATYAQTINEQVAIAHNIVHNMAYDQPTTEPF